jgi:hypothetical protein
MALYEDIMEIEQADGEDQASEACAMQRIINDGNGWRMQGSMGRSMMAAIEAGICMLGERPTQDAYGNGIPARSMVVDGTKGSRSYVAEHMGEDWARMLENV